MSLTVLPSTLFDRDEAPDERTMKKLTNAGVTTSSGLIDSGAVDSDYISTSLYTKPYAGIPNLLRSENSLPL